MSGKDHVSVNDEGSISIMMVLFSIVVSIVVVGYVLLYSKHKQIEKDIPKQTNGIPVKDFSKITPIIGELSLVLDPLVYQDQNHPKYGDIFATYFMNDVYIVMKGAELFDQVYLQNAKNIRHEWNDSFIQMFGQNSMVQVSGDEHKKQRRIVLDYIGVPSLSRVFPGFVQIFNKYVKDWIERTKDGSYINIAPELGKAIWEAMSYVIFGDDLPQETVDELGKIMIDFGYGVLAIPVNLPFTTFGKAIAAKERFRVLLKQEYQRRLTMPDKGFNRKDLLQALINETCNDGYEDGFNIDTARTIIWASLDTTKGTTLRMVDIMIDHAKEWGKARDDLRNAFGEQGILAPDVTYSRLLEETPYLAACIKEIMRYGGTGLLGMRRVLNDFEVTNKGKKYKIPAGYKIYTSFYYHHKDPESSSFADPTSFIPERYLGDQAEDKVSKYKGVNVFFGLGDRICPGNPIAKLEMEILMSLMSEYKWIRRERVKEWKPQPVPVPTEGLWIRGVPLNQ